MRRFIPPDREHSQRRSAWGMAMGGEFQGAYFAGRRSRRFSRSAMTSVSVALS